MTYREMTKELSRQTGIPESDVLLIFKAFGRVVMTCAENLEYMKINYVGRLEIRKMNSKKVKCHDAHGIYRDFVKPPYYHGFFKLTADVQAKIHAQAGDKPQPPLGKGGRSIKKIPADTQSIFKGKPGMRGVY